MHRGWICCSQKKLPHGRAPRLSGLQSQADRQSPTTIRRYARIPDRTQVCKECGELSSPAPRADAELKRPCLSAQGPQECAVPYVFWVRSHPKLFRLRPPAMIWSDPPIEVSCQIRPYQSPPSLTKLRTAAASITGRPDRRLSCATNLQSSQRQPPDLQNK